MPQRRNAIKALRQNKEHHLHNLDIKTDLRKTVKKLLVEIRDNKTEDATKTLCIVHKKIDKAAKRNLIHKNTAARRKSRFTKLCASKKAD